MPNEFARSVLKQLDENKGVMLVLWNDGIVVRIYRIELQPQVFTILCRGHSGEFFKGRIECRF